MAHLPAFDILTNQRRLVGVGLLDRGRAVHRRDYERLRPLGLLKS